MASPAAREAEANTTAAAAYRVLLRHRAALLTARELARGACVCAAWREEAARSEHRRVLRFELASDARHVARLLARDDVAPYAEELHTAFVLPDLAAALPAHAMFPQLALVRQAAPGFSRETVADVVAVMRAAPRLARWLAGAAGVADFVGAALHITLLDALRAETTSGPVPRYALRKSRIAAHEASLRGLLTAARHPDSYTTPIGMPGLAPRSSGLLEVVRVALRTRRPVRDQPYVLRRILFSCFDTPELVHLRALLEQLDPDLISAQLVSELHSAGSMSACMRPRSLLYTAAIDPPSVAATAVLLRAGADPLHRPAPLPLPRWGGQAQCPLAACADDVLELSTYAARIGLTAETAWCDPAHRALVAVAFDRIAVLLVLFQAAQQRHGDAAACAAAGPHAPFVAFAAGHPKRAARELLGRMREGGRSTAAAADTFELALAVAADAEWRERVREAQAYLVHGDALRARRACAPHFCARVAPGILFRLALLAALAAGAAWLVWKAAVLVLFLAWRLAALLLRLPLRLAARAVLLLVPRAYAHGHA